MQNKWLELLNSHVKKLKRNYEEFKNQTELVLSLKEDREDDVTLLELMDDAIDMFDLRLGMMSQLKMECQELESDRKKQMKAIILSWNHYVDIQKKCEENKIKNLLKLSWKDFQFIQYCWMNSHQLYDITKQTDRAMQRNLLARQECKEYASDIEEFLVSVRNVKRLRGNFEKSDPKKGSKIWNEYFDEFFEIWNSTQPPSMDNVVEASDLSVMYHQKQRDSLIKQVSVQQKELDSLITRVKKESKHLQTQLDHLKEQITDYQKKQKNCTASEYKRKKEFDSLQKKMNILQRQQKECDDLMTEPTEFCHELSETIHQHEIRLEENRSAKRDCNLFKELIATSEKTLNQFKSKFQTTAKALQSYRDKYENGNSKGIANVNDIY